jgi:hypothetical protein
MPVFDWQFLVVTLTALGAAAIVVRRLMPTRKVQARGGDAPPVPASPACAHCASAESAANPKQPARAAARTETVPVVPLRDLRDSAHQRRS